MAGMTASRIRVGVIGLGRPWEARHKPAMARLKDRFEVVGVYDQVARRAEIEADQLGCRAFEGLTALIERPEIDAVLLLAPQWFGSHPIELAARFGKAVYSGVPLSDAGEDLDRLDRLVRSSGIAFMAEFAPRFYPASARLLDLIRTKLGPVLDLSGSVPLAKLDRAQAPGPGSRMVAGSILDDPGQSLIDLARTLFQGEVSSVDTLKAEHPTLIDGEPDRCQFLLGFDPAETRTVTIAVRHESASEVGDLPWHPPTFQIRTQLGTAWMEWPNLIRWGDGSTDHEERLPEGPPIGEVLLDQFSRMVRGLHHSAPSWNDVVAAARVVAALRRSTFEKTRVLVPEGSAWADSPSTIEGLTP